MADPDLFVSIGVKSQDVYAGLAGGIVNAFIFQRGNPMSILGSVVVGALTAAYLTEPAAKITGTSGGAPAFIVGLGAMAICQVVINRIAKWGGTGGNP